MTRATTGAREGRYYWEAKILSGIRADSMDGEPRGHVRIGFARREAQLDGRSFTATSLRLGLTKGRARGV